MIDHNYKCIFVHVPKNAGTSITHAFGTRWHLDGGKFLNFGCADEEEWKNHTKFPDYFRFSVVRNPWDKFVSGWKWCKSTKDRTITDVLRNLPKKIEHPITPDDNHDYYHVTVTQEQFLYDNGKLIVDYLIRFEALQEGFDKVCEIIGMPKMIMPCVNQTEHKHYREYFTDVDLELFDKHYGGDAKLFGYTF
jgi:hypothetical protein